MKKSIKKILVTALALVLVFGSVQVGLNSINVDASITGIGAEKINAFSMVDENTSKVGTTYSSQITVRSKVKDYSIKVNSISALLPFYDNGAVKTFNVAYEPGTVCSTSGVKFDVSGQIDADKGSVIRYTCEYDLLDKNNEVVFAGLTGYAYGFAAGSAGKQGAVGTVNGLPGKRDTDCSVNSIDQINSCYVNPTAFSLGYETQTERWDGGGSNTPVIFAGTAPTGFTFADILWCNRENESTEDTTTGVWCTYTPTNVSGYYEFSVKLNGSGRWDDATNTESNVSMYILTSEDKENALKYAEEYLSHGLEKSYYPASAWNTYIDTLDKIECAGRAVATNNNVYKIACSNASNAQAVMSGAESVIKNSNIKSDGIFKYCEVGSNATIISVDLAKATGVVTIPEKFGDCTVDTISDGAFGGCINVTGVVIGKTVKSIGENVFSGCTALETLSVDSGNTVYDSRNDCNAIIETASNTLLYGTKKTVIPATTKIIGENAFANITDITEILIPEGVVNISEGAFKGCSGATKITIPRSVTNIGENAFDGCKAVTDVYYGGLDSDEWLEVFVKKGNNPVTNLFDTPNFHYHKHSYDKGVETTPATCTENGIKTFTCSGCGDSYTEPITKKGHIPGPAATCTTDQICTECRTVLVEKHHIPGPAASCTTDQICTECHTVLVAKKGHTPGPKATCTKDQLCRICREVLEEKKGHTPGDAATCVDPQICTVCKTELAPATGIHTPGEWETVTEPTKTTEGLKKQYCTGCRTELDSEVIPKLGEPIEPKEDSTAVIDKDTKTIYGLEEGLSSLEDFVDVNGCELDYHETANGFGTGTTVDIIVGGEVVDTYTIVIFGDVNGDGVVDNFDLADLFCVGNAESEYEEGSAYYLAGDVNGDGAVDLFDAAVVAQAGNGEIVISQQKPEQ